MTREQASPIPPISVLFRDETILAVGKPSGLLVHNSTYAGRKELSLRQLVMDQERRSGPAAESFVAPIHRLDRGASGMVLFALGADAARAWQSAWKDPKTEKLYLALIRGSLTDRRMVDHPIRQKETGVVKDARSEVFPLLVSPVERCSLVRVRLFTGRRHQIRRHLRHLGHPVVGDTTWGDGDVNRLFRASHDLHRLALHSHTLCITHPMTGMKVEVKAPLPEELARAFSSLFPGLWNGIETT